MTESTMRVSVLHAAGDIRSETRPVPVPAADEVLVRVTAVGVCGSDVHYYREGGIGSFALQQPCILGHEAGGVIVAVGSAVDPGRVGSRVSIEPQRPSATSRETLAGRYNLDPAMEFYATPPIDGAFAEFVTIQSHFAFDVPDTMSDDAAALIEPLSVAVASARKAELTVGSRVLITGAGPIGLTLAQVSRAYGAVEVVVSDIDAGRREQALRFGATSVVDPLVSDPSTLGLDSTAYFDASGSASAVLSGVNALGPAGRAVLVGLGSAIVPLPVSRIQERELVVTGVFRYANTWPTAIGLVQSGAVDLDGLVTGHFGLDAVEDALLSTARPGTVKSVVLPQV